MTVLKKRNIENPAYPELFEDLSDLIGCEYISDLTARYNKDARRIAGTMSLERYPVSQLNDLYEYLYGKKKTFPDSRAASEAFATPRTGLFSK